MSSVADKKTERIALRQKERLAMQGEFGFYLVNDFLLLFALLVVAYPLIFIISASISSPSAVISGKVYLWPVEPTLKGYEAVFKDNRVLTGYANTLFYTVVGTFVNLVMTILCAYPLSRKDFMGRNVFMFMFTFTMIFSGGMLPTYIVMQNFGLLDTRAVMIIPGAIGIYNVIVTRTFYQSNISDELLEAALLDGCDNFRFLWQIVLPLSKAITAVMILFYAVAHWNSYFGAFIYLSTRAKFPLQIFLREILILNQVTADMTYDPTLAAAKQGLSDLLKFSLIIVSSLPIWCAYPFVQKYFVKGVMIGSIKG